jgi:glycosyltransferase involved in cell wall biosynthesis
MAGLLPVVCIFGVENISLESLGPVPVFETSKLDCRCYLTDDDLYSVLAKDRPGAIISFGKQEDFPNLYSASFEVRRKWVNYEKMDDLAKIGGEAFYCYLHSLLAKRDSFPLVTVFTPAYRTGDKILRPFQSLVSQKYKDWEWVIMDDSDDGGKTFEMLTELAKKDYRIRLYRADRNSGVIGHVKRDACMLGRGEFLVELDHDDELTPWALEKVVAAYQSHPEAGFVYTDFAECFEDGSPVEYPKGWGFGYGSYREEIHGGVKYLVSNGPNVNPKTIRHIIAAPNHIRSWRRSFYNDIGGHGDNIHVADDYELMVRTFLGTRMVRVPSCCYIQYRNAEGNTHKVRNQEIQRLVRYFSTWYDKAIHQRFLELGIDDYVYKEGEYTFWKLGNIPNCEKEQIANLVFEG